MLESTRSRMGLLLSVTLALTGCQAGALQSMTAAPKATGTTGFAGEKENAAGINGNGKANPNGNGNGNNGKGGDEPPSTPAAGASSAPAGNTPGAAAGSGSVTPTEPAKPPTTGVDVGLSTFFDTYNFNFPVPAGQALGTVANISQKVVPLAGGKVYLQIGLQTAAATATPTQRAPLNVSFVFDKSGSMYGEKIAYSRTAAERMVDQLDSQDTFSLVTFDSTIATLILPGFAVDKPTWKQSIRGIMPGSATNIDGGMAEGYKRVRSQFKPASINRVILMSDGEANVGIIDKETLGQRASASARDGITLSTIGVGTDFNEQFMTHLAEQGLGSYYYVNSEEAALQAFAGEVSSLQRIVARNVKLDIQLASGVQLVQVYGHTAKTVGQSLNVDTNDLIGGQSKVILLELNVPAGAEGAAMSLAKVVVDFDDVPFGGTKQATAEASVKYTADQAAIANNRDSQIASSVIILQTASVLLRAADLLDNGSFGLARTELQKQLDIVRAKATELNDADLKAEAGFLEAYIARIGQEDESVLAKEMQFDAFQKQQGKKKVATPVAAS